MLTLQLLIVLRSMFLLHWNRRLCSHVLLFMIVGYIWRKTVPYYAISVVIF